MRLHILLAEDDQVKRAAVLALLGDAGIDMDHVVQATDLRAASRLLTANRFDILILDIAMPRDPGGAVDADAGLSLLSDILDEDGGLLSPRQVVGLSGYEEVIERAQSDFDRHGCVFVRYSASESAWRVPLRAVVENARKGLAPGNEAYRSHAVVICALREPELSAMLRNGWTWNRYVVRGDDSEYHRGTLPDGRVVFAAAASRMGTEATVSIAGKAIEHFRPKYLGMCGISAGVAERTQFGDVIVADPVWNWGSGKWKTEGKKRLFLPDPHQIALESGVRKLALALAEDRVHLAKVKAAWAGGGAPPFELNVRVGPLASGPAVLADGQGIAQVLQQHRKLLGIDMEAYGLFAAAAEATLQRPFPIVMKSVVDHADAGKGDEFQHYGAYTSAALLSDLLVRLE